MRDKKLQVFVSSTYTDLREERQAAVEAILSSGNIPAGMELFTAGDESQMTVIKRWIDESDVYLLILGGRYGSLESKTGKSYTHLEFEYAVSQQKPWFAVVIDDQALEDKVKIFGREVIEQENTKELKAFRETVKGIVVKFWKDTKDIKIAVHETLSEFSYRKELVGWVRGGNTVNTGILAEEIARLTKENSELRNQVAKLLSSTTALFAGLPYQQLKELLEGEIIKIGGVPTNLFQFLLSFGPEFSNGAHFVQIVIEQEIPEDALNVLLRYKLIHHSTGNDNYIFTTDGHSFYMNALSQASNKQL